MLHVRVNDSELRVRNRFQGIIAFAAIVATCLAGVFHLSWWAPVAGAAVLAMVSITNHSIRYSTIGGSGLAAQRILMVSSGINATLTSVAAMIVGGLIGRAFGIQ